MGEIFNIGEIVAGESFRLSFAAPEGATAAEALFTGVSRSTHFALEGGSFVASVTSETTLAFSPRQGYAVFVTSPDGRRCVERGTLAVVRLNSQYREALQAVESAIASWGSNPNQTITVGEINISYKTLSDLFALRSYYRGLVAEEEGGGDAVTGGPFIIGTRFG